MTTRKFTICQQGDLKARFDAANANLRLAQVQVRDLAAQLQAELDLARLFGDRQGEGPP